MAEVVDLKVGGVTRKAIEVEFEAEPEPWCVYRLADGGRLRLRITVTRIYRALDANGNPGFTVDGDPDYIYRHQIQAVGSA